jgi:hypothetical protein
MNPIKQWMAKRAAIAANRRAAEEAERRALLEQRRAMLKKEMDEVAADLAKVGLAVMERKVSQEDGEQGRMYAINPSGRIIKINVNYRGGFTIEKIL